ncbi:ead/Ea22-like family protein [Escherichia coli]|nr:ead/Ea22-like family protein [Escherichia coli]EFL6361583.1 ead/Ea22-like family protein [Escherichia coli]
MKFNKQELRKAAEKATEGNYVVGHCDINKHGNLSSVYVCQEWNGMAGGVVAECHVNCLTKNSDQVYANAEFMALASPANVISLLEEISTLESRCAALAAENAGLKAALRPFDIPSEWTDAFGDTAVIEHDATGDNQGHSVSWSWVGNQEEVIKYVLLAVDGSIKTPATDAFLAEVRAQGVEMAAKSDQFSTWVQQGLRSFAIGVRQGDECADELRKGVQS